MGRVIGIDLGTTNSCVAMIENGQPVIVPSRTGARRMPIVQEKSNQLRLLQMIECQMPRLNKQCVMHSSMQV